MICRRCGNRIPENLAARESFRCPNCGRQFGTPVQEERPSFNFDDPPRRSRFAGDDVRNSSSVRASGSRFADPADAYYDDQPYADDADAYYDDQPYADADGYYDDQPYADADGYYDDQSYADDADAYYDDQPYADDDGYYDDQPYADGDPVDLSDFAASDDPSAPGMKLTTVIFALILEVTALIAVFGISLFL
ncbi:MAG: hypothetical protein IJO98_05115 [Clostridia bacterium]|nr:hypothetical protein [Clostridia bacterium]